MESARLWRKESIPEAGLCLVSNFFPLYSPFLPYPCPFAPGKFLAFQLEVRELPPLPICHPRTASIQIFQAVSSGYNFTISKELYSRI